MCRRAAVGRRSWPVLHSGSAAAPTPPLGPDPFGVRRRRSLFAVRPAVMARRAVLSCRCRHRCAAPMSFSPMPWRQQAHTP